MPNVFWDIGGSSQVYFDRIVEVFTCDTFEPNVSGKLSAIVTF